MKKFDNQGRVSADPHQLELARSYEKNLQNLGRSLVSSMYMLIRNVRLYDPDNEVFLKPLEQLKDGINEIVVMDGKIVLQGAGNTFYLNNMLLKFDSRSIDNMLQLAAELEKHDVGGFEMDRPITVEELRDFIFLFKNDKVDRSEEQQQAVSQLAALKVTRYERIKEILKGKQGQPAAAADTPAFHGDRKLDRKRYSMLLYARTVQFMRKYVAGLRGMGPEIPRGNAATIIQDLVEVTQEKKQHFIGMTTAKDIWDAYCFHVGNVATLSVVFASVLRLKREQLRDLGMAALFHDVGRVSKDGLRPESPSDEIAQRRPIQIDTFRTLLPTAPLTKTSINALIASFEAQLDFWSAEHTPHRMEVGLYAKIIALADGYDNLATNDTVDTAVIMEILSTQLKDKYDPILLRLFTKTMSVWTATSRGQALELF